VSDDTFWQSLDRISITAPTRWAIKLLLLTGQRAGEITGARTDEVDLDRAAWTIPGSRTKNDRTHMAPLSGSAAALFAEALKSARDGFVFPSPKEGQAMTRRALSRAISRNRSEIGVGPFSLHDLRRTVASQVAAAGIDRLVVSKVLNHVSADRDTVTGFVYDRHGYEPEKRRALQRWAERLAAIVDETPQAAKVVELR
jgi:integrase